MTPLLLPAPCQLGRTLCFDLAVHAVTGEPPTLLCSGDRLPEDEGDEEAGNEAAGSEDEGQE